MSKVQITLGDMRAKGMTMLVVSCDRCGRQGRLRIARLSASASRVIRTLASRSSGTRVSWFWKTFSRRGRSRTLAHIDTDAVCAALRLRSTWPSRAKALSPRSTGLGEANIVSKRCQHVCRCWQQIRPIVHEQVSAGPARCGPEIGRGVRDL